MHPYKYAGLLVIYQVLMNKYWCIFFLRPQINYCDTTRALYIHLCFYCSVSLPDKTEKKNIYVREIAIQVLQLLDQFYTFAIKSLILTLE